MYRVLNKKQVHLKVSSVVAPTARGRCSSQLAHNMKDNRHSDNPIEMNSSIFSFPSYDNNEQIRKDIQTLARSRVPLNTLRSVGKQLQPRARVKWDFYVQHVEEKLKETEDKLVALLEIKPSEKFQQVRTRPRTLTPSAYIPSEKKEPEPQSSVGETTTVEESISHAVNFLRSRKETSPDKTNDSDNYWRGALASFLEETYRDKAPTDEQRYLDKWNLSSEFIGYKWQVEDFDDKLVHWEDAPLVVFPCRRGYHYYKFESLSYPFPDYIQKMEELERNETLGLWQKITQFEFLEPIRIAEEIAKDKANLTESNLSTPLKEKLEYCKNELSKLPKYQKAKTQNKKEWSDSGLYHGSVREVADIVFAGAVARAKITGNEPLVGPLTKLYETLLFNDTEKFASNLSLTLANNLNLRNFLQHHIISYFGEKFEYPHIFQQFAPKIHRSNEFSVQEERKLVSKVTDNLLPGGIIQIDEEIERIRKGEPDEFEMPSISSLSKEDFEQMKADVEEIEKRGPAQFQTKAKTEDTRDTEHLQKTLDTLVEEDTLDDIDTPELEEIELKLREALEPQKNVPLKMPTDKWKDENFNESFVDTVNQMEIEDLEDEFPTESKIKRFKTTEEMEAEIEKQMENIRAPLNEQLAMGNVEADSDHFIIPPPIQEEKYEVKSDMSELERQLNEIDTSDDLGVENMDLSSLDPTYNFLERTEQQIAEEKQIHPTMMSERFGILNLKLGKLFLVQRTTCIKTNRVPLEKTSMDQGLLYTPFPQPEFGDSRPYPTDLETGVLEKEVMSHDTSSEEHQSGKLYNSLLEEANHLRATLNSIDQMKRDNCVSEKDKEGFMRLESILTTFAKRNNIPLSHGEQETEEESESLGSSLKSLENELDGKDEVIINTSFLKNLGKDDEDVELKGEGEKAEDDKGVSAEDDKEAVALDDGEYDSKNENMEEEGEEEPTDLDPAYTELMDMVATTPIPDTNEKPKAKKVTAENLKELTDQMMKEALGEEEKKEQKSDEEEPTSEESTHEPLDVDEVIRIYETLSDNPNTEQVKKDLKRLISFDYLPSKTMQPGYYHGEIRPEDLERLRIQTEAEGEELKANYELSDPSNFLGVDDGPMTLQSKMIDIPPKQLLELKKVTWPFATPALYTNPLRLILSVDWSKQSCPWPEE